MAISNATLSLQISELVASWQLNVDERAAWLAGTVGGGPNLDGTYPLTDHQGTTYSVKCPAQLQADVDALTDEAGGYTTNAEASAAAAENSKLNADSAALLASNWAILLGDTVNGTEYSAKHHAQESGTHATAASTAKTDAQAARDAAQVSETNASGSASAAATSETNAASSASAAAGSASTASTHETNAGASASAAAASETNAAGSATDAANSAAALALPDPAVADTYLRRNSGNTAYETKTPLQVADELIGVRDWRGRNVLINGDFRVWQEGTSFVDPGTGGYTAEGWSVRGAAATGGSYIVSKGVGATPFTNLRPYFYLSCTGLTSNWYKFQRVEDVRTLAGQTVTLALDTNFDVDARVEILFTQYFGSGGGASASTNTLSDNKTITSGERRTAYTVTLPSISGKTIDGENHYLQTTVYLRGPSADAPSDGIYRFTDIQLEPGSVATPFERRSIQQELALCQRYFVDFPNKGSIYSHPGLVGSYVDGANGFVAFPVQMRTAPSVTIRSNAGTAGAVDDTNSSAEITGVTLSAHPEGITRLYKQSAFTVGRVYTFTYTANARL